MLGSLRTRVVEYSHFGLRVKRSLRCRVPDGSTVARSTHHPAYRVFLDTLREARKATGVTQVELADRLGNRQVFVSKLERGERRMDIVDLHEYCTAAGIDFDGFMADLRSRWAALPRSERELGKLAVQRPRKQRRR